MEDTGQLSWQTIKTPPVEIDILLLTHSAKKKKAVAVKKAASKKAMAKRAPKKGKKRSHYAHVSPRRPLSSSQLNQSNNDDDSNPIDPISQCIRVRVLKNIAKEKSGDCLYSADTTSICAVKLNW
eukprot:CAMPEP_0194336704 /NCGR_PEP_ID=MMETSP0171-20130528/73885_1 /TAXON_ID=218684 /ORGANISM="Corethron pennatum, Strain L29A3" /LENGTH=124 /DNA_ID=CAMNT_0039100245 /DNA_START=654 /DNA_END=1025 /DNA_ORIENTATION=+